jgi:flavin reductase (DIM6/NTAB) family NADH-FMN oxidoreductase RutF
MNHICYDLTRPGGPDPYDLLIHAVAPRPIAFVSTISASGEPNLAPFSFFMAAGSAPPSVCFSPCTKADGSAKDTLRNIQETGEYVIHTVSREMLAGVVASAAPLPHGQSEWPCTGFSALPSIRVQPSRVAEAPMALECRLHQILPHGCGPDAANYVIGEVLAIHVREDLLTDGEVDPARVGYLARLGANWYLEAQEQALLSYTRPR